MAKFLFMHSGMSYENFERPKDREKRELARLPQPQQQANCSVYLKKDPGTGKVLTVYDYSKNRKVACESKMKVKNLKNTVASSKPKTDEERFEERLKIKVTIAFSLLNFNIVNIWNS